MRLFGGLAGGDFAQIVGGEQAARLLRMQFRRIGRFDVLVQPMAD